MQFNQRSNIKHAQSIVMNSQLRQAIKLLQFSNLELSSYIEEEIEKPFLENKSDIFSNTDSLKSLKSDAKDDSILENDKDTQRWEDKFSNKHSSGSYDEISSIEDRIAEPKKLKVILNGTNSVGYSKGKERR